MVKAVSQKLAFLVVDPGKATRHSCSEIEAGGPQNHGQSAGHVLTTVIAHTLHDGQSSGIAHRKSLPGATGGKQGTSCSAVKSHVSQQSMARTVFGRAP